MLIDIFFPKFCLGCGFLGTYICLACEKKMEGITSDTCLYCEQKSYLGITHPSCKRIRGVDGFLSIFHYGPTVRAIIKNIKYRGVYDACNELFLLMNSNHTTKFFEFNKTHKEFFLQPIPLHKNRLRGRGFNQSEIIANFFGSILQQKKVQIIERIKETHAQAQAGNRSERKKNIRGAFTTVPQKTIPAKIVLIDDVVTTGNTVLEAAAILKEAGAQEVYVFSLARG